MSIGEVAGADGFHYQSSSSSSSSSSLSSYDSRKNKRNKKKKKKKKKKKGGGNKKKKTNNDVKGFSKRHELKCYWELPEYMKDNEFILKYYRADWPILDAFCSVFRWHNETLNVWTHLIGTICHLFSCHSHHLNVFLLRLDYAGITTFFPPIYYIFQCDPRWQFIYLGGIILMGLCTIVTLFSPVLSSPKFRTLRALLFASMGLFGIVPAVHASIVNWGNPKRDITLVYEVAMAVFYLMGTGFYITRIPERWRPGCFDLAGHSHQIFHVLVVMGALAHYAAILVMIDWRSSLGCDINASITL